MCAAGTRNTPPPALSSFPALALPGREGSALTGGPPTTHPPTHPPADTSSRRHACNRMQNYCRVRTPTWAPPQGEGEVTSRDGGDSRRQGGHRDGPNNLRGCEGTTAGPDPTHPCRDGERGKRKGGPAREGGKDERNWGWGTGGGGGCGRSGACHGVGGWVGLGGRLHSATLSLAVRIHGSMGGRAQRSPRFVFLPSPGPTPPCPPANERVCRGQEIRPSGARGTGQEITPPPLPAPPDPASNADVPPALAPTQHPSPPRPPPQGFPIKASTPVPPPALRRCLSTPQFSGGSGE